MRPATPVFEATPGTPRLFFAARLRARLRRSLRQVWVRIALGIGALALLFNMVMGGMFATMVCNEMQAALGREVQGLVDRAAEDLDERVGVRLAALGASLEAASGLFGDRTPPPELAGRFLDSAGTLAVVFDHLTVLGAEGDVLAARPFTPSSLA